MMEALKEAQNGSLPYGAVVVKDGKIVAKAGSGAPNDPTAHAEVKAIRMACMEQKTKYLTGCTLYSTCEPCAMCFGAAWWADIAEIVYGASLDDSAKYCAELPVSIKKLNQESGKKMLIRSGLLKDECASVLKRWETLNRTS